MLEWHNNSISNQHTHCQFLRGLFLKEIRLAGTVDFFAIRLLVEQEGSFLKNAKMKEGVMKKIASVMVVILLGLTGCVAVPYRYPPPAYYGGGGNIGAFYGAPYGAPYGGYGYGGPNITFGYYGGGHGHGGGGYGRGFGGGGGHRH